MLLSGYERRKLYARTRIASRTEPNLQWSLEPCGVDVIALMGTESQLYVRDALKIWGSFFLGVSRICCGVMKQ
jgi:hypothetical protein